jgi:HSP20 family protein
MSLLFQRLSKEFMNDIGAKSKDVYELILPAVDMYEEGSDLVIVLDMPGFTKDEIKTRLTEAYLTVNARREREERDGIVYWEQRPLKVHKRIPLPAKIEVDDETNSVGKYENGTLTIRLPLKGVGKVRVE